MGGTGDTPWETFGEHEACEDQLPGSRVQKRSLLPGGTSVQCRESADLAVNLQAETGHPLDRICWSGGCWS